MRYIYEVQFLNINVTRLMWTLISLIWSYRFRQCRFVSSMWRWWAQWLVASAQKTASVWWCCCGCSLEFIYRERYKEKALRQIALWISALNLLFLVCAVPVGCHDWNAAEMGVKDGEIWKDERQRILIFTSVSPTCPLPPKNTYINWRMPV